MEEHSTASTLSEDRGAVWPLLTAVGLIYVSLGTLLGFVQGGIAPVLRSQGMDLASIRWVYLLFIPFGIAFLWAPRIDSWRWPWLGRRTGWIVPMQIAAIGSIVVASAFDPMPGNWSLLLALGIIATLCAATMDLALDALTVEQVTTTHRPTAAAAKVGGISLGSVLGGGLLIALYPKIGWQGTLLFIAVIMTVATIPVIALINRDRTLSNPSIGKRASLRETLHKPGMAKKLIRISIITCTMMALFNFNRLLLVDMGMPLERIGGVLGTIAPAANAVASLLILAAIPKIALHRIAWGVAFFCIVSASLLWLGFSLGSADTAMLGSILISASASAMYVVLGSLILEWASGSQAATDYGLLYGLGRLVATLSLVALPPLIQSIGWLVFLSVLMTVFAAAFWWFMRLFPK